MRGSRPRTLANRRSGVTPLRRLHIRRSTWDRALDTERTRIARLVRGHNVLYSVDMALTYTHD